MVCFERDLIAEMNRKAEMKRSIIKSWNVNYIDAETVKRLEEEARALEVYQRLEDEKALDEAKKQEEIKKAYQEREKADRQWMDVNYNASTGSFSGIYGQNSVDNVTKNQVELILHEKDAAIQKIIAGNAAKI